MKGFSHFVSAIAAATFVPGVVELAAQEQSLILVLAGVFGLLPDWLDFKWARYLEPADVDIYPEPDTFDAQAIADEVAGLIEEAYETDEPLQMQLHTMPLGPDRWQQYSLRFDNRNNEVAVRLGPVVTTGQRPVGPIPDHPPSPPLTGGERGVARVNAPMNYTYDGEMKIDIFEGPSFEFIRLPQPDGAERVEISFLPWHRRWSHSLVLAAAFGILVGALFGSLAGWAVGVGFAVHVLEDQLGYMGSNLYWPFTSRRSSGLQLMHSGDAIPNFLTVWTACGLILFNLNRFAPTPQFDGNTFLLWAAAVPALIMLSAQYYFSKERKTLRAEAEREREIMQELEETIV